MGFSQWNFSTKAEIGALPAEGHVKWNISGKQHSKD